MSRKTNYSRSLGGSFLEAGRDPVALEAGIGPQLGIVVGTLVDHRGRFVFEQPSWRCAGHAWPGGWRRSCGDDPVSQVENWASPRSASPPCRPSDKRPAPTVSRVPSLSRVSRVRRGLYAYGVRRLDETHESRPVPRLGGATSSANSVASPDIDRSTGLDVTNPWLGPLAG